MLSHSLAHNSKLEVIEIVIFISNLILLFAVSAVKNFFFRVDEINKKEGNHM